MKDYLQCYIIEPNATIMDALKQIDKNTKGFVIVTDKNETAQGIITDGDIRRAFIDGISISDKVSSVYRQNFKFLFENSNIAEATDLFKSSSIKFLPILSADFRLTNLITKQQMHSMRLLDIHADLTYDFCSLDESIVDYEIFQRPWGFYKTTVMNNYFQSKVISVNPHGQLSLQSHKRREEHWIIAHGNGTVQIDDSLIEVHCGSTIFIPKGAKHRLTNTDDKESLIVTEIQIGDYFNEDDIIRFEDIYGRKQEGNHECSVYSCTGRKQIYSVEEY